MDTFNLVLKLIFAAWCIASTIVVFMNYFRCKPYDPSKFFVAGVVFGALAFFYILFFFLLHFIPDSWGGLDEDGVFQSTRKDIATMLGFFSAIAFLIYFDKWGLKRKRGGVGS